jgi:peptidyl-prolyl cis-trans isomerase C
MKLRIHPALLLTLFVFLAVGCNDSPEETLSKESESSEDNKVITSEDADLKENGDDGENTSPTPSEKVEPALDAKAEPTNVVERETRLTGPVATVNGKAIDSNKFYKELDKAAKHGAKIPPERVERIKSNILNRIIEEELISQAVDQEKIRISKKNIEKSFKEYREKFKSTDQFANYLKHGKHTEESIRERIRQKKSLEKLIEKKGSRKISKKEIQEFYDKNKMFYQEKEAVHARHILFKIKRDADAKTEANVMKRVKRVEKLLLRGVDFASLAKEFSEGPTAPKGGDLGFFSRGQMVKPFEDVAFILKPAETSAPVRTRFGFHLIQVTERRDESQKPLKEVQSQIQSSLKNKRYFQERRRILELLKSEAKIVDNISEEAGK